MRKWESPNIVSPMRISRMDPANTGVIHTTYAN